MVGLVGSLPPSKNNPSRDGLQPARNHAEPLSRGVSGPSHVALADHRAAGFHLLPHQRSADTTWPHMNHTVRPSRWPRLPGKHALVGKTEVPNSEVTSQS